MCGIAGWIGPPDPEGLQRMRGCLRHRGPDDEGDSADTLHTLLHERLSIIDLSGGHQPMVNEGGRYSIVFNGEIYNYRELREELLGRGHVMRTHSDTEVILHLFEELGPACCARLIGMFAFAVWDDQERRLVLARDRLGVKPLFYARTKERFLFASELKAVLAQFGPNAALDPEALDRYLTFMYVPGPATIVKGVRKLQPGHTLTVTEGREDLRAFWSLPGPEAEPEWASEREATDDLSDTLREAVRCRLISEVPLGAYLSGGLDSSLVVGLMARSSADPVNTFSVGFEERGFDERPWARVVAEAFRTSHRELVVRCDATNALPKIIRALDEPVADSAAIPTYFMAQATKPHVTVVLTGEGADELFAGYSHYKILCMANALRGLSPGRAAQRLGGWLPRHGPLARGIGFAGMLRDPAAAYLALKSVFTPEEKAALYAPGLRDAAAHVAPPDAVVRRFLGPGKGPYLHQLLRLDLATWLPDDLLVKVDRMTMAHGVEARVPYLDHRVVEKVLRMPPDWKLRRGTGKRILRAVARRILPPEIARRRKTGFAVPVGDWASNALREQVGAWLGPESVRRRGLLEPKAVAALTNAPSYGMFERRQLWTLLCLELWCREFLDRAPTSA